MSNFTPRVFSGVQPTGNLHLGNYLGAIVRFVALQETHDCIYCVVDMHAITVLAGSGASSTARRHPRGDRRLPRRRHRPEEAQIVFNQSQVRVHAELAWVFNCVARMGWLNRMTQFKEKAGKDRENASVGLFAYPMLMAADILAYLATHVPVGEDQKQHLELTRDIAIKFNNDFAESIADNGFGDAFFPVTEPLITGPATRVMSLRDGTKKMSKSDPSDYSRINLTDDADTIAQKIRKAKTDPEPLPSEVDGPEGPARGRQPRRHLCRRSPASTQGRRCSREFGGAQFSAFKPALADLAVAKLAPIAGEMRRLLADPGLYRRRPRDGAERARAIAEKTMDGVKDVVGFVRKRSEQSAVLAGGASGASVRLPIAIRRRRGSIRRHADDPQEHRGRPPPEIPGRHRRHAGMHAARSSSPARRAQHTGGARGAALCHRARRVHRSGSASRTSCAPRRRRRPRQTLGKLRRHGPRQDR